MHLKKHAATAVPSNRVFVGNILATPPPDARSTSRRSGPGMDTAGKRPGLTDCVAAAVGQGHDGGIVGDGPPMPEMREK